MKKAMEIRIKLEILHLNNAKDSSLFYFSQIVLVF